MPRAAAWPDSSMQADEYLKLAEVEDRMWYFRSLHGHVRRELERVLPPRAEVLDAGCGTGGLMLRLRAAHPEWRLSGVDFVPLACDLARQRCGPGVEVREGSVLALPFAPGSFDAVTSNDVLCQVDDPAAALREFFRALRPGGVAVINLPAYMWMWSYHDTAVANRRRYTRPELVTLLGAAGFRLVRATYWNALLLPVAWAKRRLLSGSGAASDVRLQPAPIEAALGATMALEHAWLRAGGNWAWGLSVLAVGQKPA